MKTSNPTQGRKKWNYKIYVKMLAYPHFLQLKQHWRYLVCWWQWQTHVVQWGMNDCKYIYIVRCWYNVLSWKCRHRKTHANGFRKVRQHRNLSDWDRKKLDLKWTYHGERGESSSTSKSADTGATIYLRKSVGLKFYFEMWNNDSEMWDAELGFPIRAKSILHDMSQLSKKKISSAMLGLWMQLWREKKGWNVTLCVRL